MKKIGYKQLTHKLQIILFALLIITTSAYGGESNIIQFPGSTNNSSCLNDWVGGPAQPILDVSDEIETLVNDLLYHKINPGLGDIVIPALLWIKTELRFVRWNARSVYVHSEEGEIESIRLQLEDLLTELEKLKTLDSLKALIEVNDLITQKVQVLGIDEIFTFGPDSFLRFEGTEMPDFQIKDPYWTDLEHVVRVNLYEIQMRNHEYSLKYVISAYQFIANAFDQFELIEHLILLESFLTQSSFVEASELELIESGEVEAFVGRLEAKYEIAVENMQMAGIEVPSKNYAMHFVLENAFGVASVFKSSSVDRNPFLHPLMGLGRSPLSEKYEDYKFAWLFSHISKFYDITKMDLSINTNEPNINNHHIHYIHDYFTALRKFHESLNELK